MFDYKFICGLVFGIQQDTAYLLDEENEEPEETSMIQVFLGPLVIVYIFV